MESMEDIVRRIVREELAAAAASEPLVAIAPPPEVPWNPRALYSVARAAELLDVSTDYVYKAIREGRLASVELGTERAKRRVSAAALEEFIVARKRGM